MKRYKEVRKYYTYLESMVCDICGKTTDKGDWSKNHYTVDETEIKYKSGDQSQDGGYGIEYSFDICPECFDKKILVFLKSCGCDITPKEWDW